MWCCNYLLVCSDVGAGGTQQGSGGGHRGGRGKGKEGEGRSKVSPSLLHHLTSMCIVAVVDGVYHTWYRLAVDFIRLSLGAGLQVLTTRGSLLQSLSFTAEVTNKVHNSYSTTHRGRVLDENLSLSLSAGLQ